LLTDQARGPVVLLHGFGASAIGWLPVATPLSKIHNILAPDLPGHGGAHGYFVEPSLDSLAQHVEDGLGELDVTDLHLVGHSLGGAVALAMVSRQRVKIHSLTLISPAGCGPAINHDFFGSFLAARSTEDMAAVLASSVSPGFSITAPMVRSAINTVHANGAILSRLVSAIGSQDLRAPTEILAKFTGPVQVIWGAEDMISPPENAQALTRYATVDYLPGVGHLPHIEQPKTIAEFIARLPTVGV
jgi:pyruvate dehydrogenase E2 component (dihydrolipoamide acetyltransferase)